MPPEIVTVKDQIIWSYANLARADAALQEKALKYKRTHHIIRNKTFYGLKSGSMKIRSLYYDERLKMIFPQACCYCGSMEKLSLDHLIPKIRGGVNEADNLVWSCRCCNSSKQGQDMLEWMNKKEKFPPILLLRRYLKIIAKYCEDREIMDMSLEEVKELNLPFCIKNLPTEFPPLTELKLWIYPEENLF